MPQDVDRPARHGTGAWLLGVAAAPATGHALVLLSAALLLGASQVPQVALGREWAGWTWSDLALLESFGLTDIGTGALLWVAGALVGLHFAARLLVPVPAPSAVVGPLAAPCGETIRKAGARALQTASSAGIRARVAVRADGRMAQIAVVSGHGRLAAAAWALAGLATLGALGWPAAAPSPWEVELGVDGAAQVREALLRPTGSHGPARWTPGGCLSEGTTLACQLQVDGRTLRFDLRPGRTTSTEIGELTWRSSRPAPVTAQYGLKWHPPDRPEEWTGLETRMHQAWQLEGTGATLWTFASALGPFVVRTGPALRVASAPAVAPKREPDGALVVTVPSVVRVQVGGAFPWALWALATLAALVALGLDARYPTLRVVVRIEGGRLVARVAPSTARGLQAVALDIARQAVGWPRGQRPGG